MLLVGAIIIAASACVERQRARSDSAATVASSDPSTAFRARIGRTWELARLGDRDIPRPASTDARPARYPGSGSRPTIRFTAEPATGVSARPGASIAGGWSFCNGYGTGYELGPGDELRFHGFQSTLVGCDLPDSLETRFFRALARVERFRLEGDTLTLIDPGGARLTLVPSPAGSGPPP